MNGIRSGFWRDFWALLKPYWFSEERLIARLPLFAIIALTLGNLTGLRSWTRGYCCCVRILVAVMRARLSVPALSCLLRLRGLRAW